MFQGTSIDSAACERTTLRSLSGGLGAPIALVRGMSRTTSVTSQVSADEAPEELSGLLTSVCKVFTSAVRPSFAAPWTNHSPESWHGSAFVLDVEKRLIVTNAHCVEFARTILLRREGQADKFEACLLACAHQCDLAILTVNDEGFWATGQEDVSDVTQVELGHLPKMQQSVDVVGFPIGGDSVCITTGVVSRIDFGAYSQSRESNLLVQVDAAINGGNSGGPAFSKGKLVGVAFQGLPAKEADGVGFIIPVSILRRVLEDFFVSARDAGLPAGPKEGGWGAISPNVPVVTLRGFGRVAFDVQTAESPHLRASLKLPSSVSGVVVRKVPAVSNLSNVLKDDDVIAAVDDYRITNDGRITVAGTTLDFQHVVTSKLCGEVIRFTVFRDGVKQVVESLAENPPEWAKEINKSLKVHYVQFAGLVFSAITNSDVGKGLDGLAPFVEDSAKIAGRKHVKPDQELIILSSLLPHSINIGYDKAVAYNDWQPEPLLSVNGADVDCLVDVARCIALAVQSRTEFLTFAFANSERIVLPVEPGLEASKQLCADFGMLQGAVSEEVLVKLGNLELASLLK